MTTIDTTDRFTTLPDEATVSATVRALEEHGFSVQVVEDLEAARRAVLDRIPHGSSVMTMDGTWQRVLDELRRDCDQAEGGDWTVGVDSLTAKAHQHAAGAPRSPAVLPHTGGHANDFHDQDTGVREALGRSRGGLSTKVHLAADRRCRPVARVLTAGQRNDAVVFEAVMARIRVHRRGRGRARTRPSRVLADKAYSSRAIRASLRRRGIRATIPEQRLSARPAAEPDAFAGRLRAAQDLLRLLTGEAEG
jgi:hypothetical protein